MQKTNAAHHFTGADFSRKVRNALSSKGITIIGATVIPSPDLSLPWASGERGYQLDDNGTHRVRSYAAVIALAGVR